MDTHFIDTTHTVTHFIHNAYGSRLIDDKGMVLEVRIDTRIEMKAARGSYPALPCPPPPTLPHSLPGSIK